MENLVFSRGILCILWLELGEAQNTHYLVRPWRRTLDVKFGPDGALSLLRSDAGKLPGFIRLQCADATF
jgi:hypothetical protein